MSTGELRRAGGGLMDRLGQVFLLAGYIDILDDLLGLLRQWNAVEGGWGTTEGFRGRVTILFAAAKLITAKTPSESDDQLVAQLEKLLANDAMVEFLASIIARFVTENPAATPEGLLAFVEREDIKQSLAEAAVEKAIDFNSIMEAIKLIIQLVSLFKGATGGNSSGESGGGSAWDF